MPESACAWRLSIVLRELRYPAQKWMILTAADFYGADVQTRIELQDLPEVTYHDIGEVIAAVENRVGRPSATPEPPHTGCCEWGA
jgi:hypothetical protein